ncbi:hypothetical protein CC80DRAFT_2217 [Byssothecium circinans]|uniref:Uncharacterized protein n=1 Tax=Byssothecium circinans TaxID=147558 RepID=A0A6A5UH74_9PLEO|nr:hypothetical protein CC80DRAFT_2217 [Byssothecium circinans]
MKFPVYSWSTQVVLSCRGSSARLKSFYYSFYSPGQTCSNFISRLNRDAQNILHREAML